MGHNPPPPPPTAVERLKLRYARGSISFAVFEERLDYLLREGLTEARHPMPYEVPARSTR